ncbi:hypothetical protein AKJ62_02250 [candidate division MSBL1 archaeon SCGC-AAA259D14]|uniref:Uncharacterized protein n=1 Tax=candidate division MSBL1 archaeon SCGC-AAA259D14 TaxID=1698261 RepID=A0A133U6N1_9EURY|nr:hypothetical protein AKJ62_02250 [candidate division MSBL1 archaeon SCGC-AAA259D14]
MKVHDFSIFWVYGNENLNSVASNSYLRLINHKNLSFPFPVNIVFQIFTNSLNPALYGDVFNLDPQIFQIPSQLSQTHRPRQVTMNRIDLNLGSDPFPFEKI